MTHIDSFGNNPDDIWGLVGSGTRKDNRDYRGLVLAALKSAGRGLKVTELQRIVGGNVYSIRSALNALVGSGAIVRYCVTDDYGRRRARFGLKEEP